MLARGSGSVLEKVVLLEELNLCCFVLCSAIYRCINSSDFCVLCAGVFWTGSDRGRRNINLSIICLRAFGLGIIFSSST